jgi:hypothetical protein
VPEYVSPGSIWRVETRRQCAQRLRVQCPWATRDIACLAGECEDPDGDDVRHRPVPWERFDADAGLDFDQELFCLLAREAGAEQYERALRLADWRASGDQDPGSVLALADALDRLAAERNAG